MVIGAALEGWLGRLAKVSLTLGVTAVSCSVLASFVLPGVQPMSVFMWCIGILLLAAGTMAVAGLILGFIAAIGVFRVSTRETVLATTGVMLSLVALVIPLRTFWPMLEASETKAVVSLSDYASAQIAYRDRSETFATSYTILLRARSDAATQPPRFMDSADTWGYGFKECTRVAGAPVDWKTDYALCATPVKYGFLTRRTFVVITTGEVWAKDLGSAEFVEDFPGCPEKKGWLRLRKPSWPPDVATHLRGNSLPGDKNSTE